MNAAFTLGAGSFASSVTLGAAYGYSMMWVPLYSFTFGIFFLALAARFVCQSETPIIEAQNRYHGKFFGTFATGLLAGCIASVVFNFGQYALGADAIINMFAAFDIHISKGLCCLILLAVSVPLSLMYGSGENPKGVKIVENAIKVMIGIMLIVFIAVVCVTGINVPAMIKGLLIPKLPSGIDGMVTLIASMTATIGVMDWLLFNNGMIARGFSEDHERLGRFDAFCGGLLPVTLVLSLVSIAFAEAFSGKPGIPTTSSELCEALMGVIPSVWIQAGFYLGVLAMVLSSMIGLSATCATSFYQSLNIPRDTKGLVSSLGRSGAADRLPRRVLRQAGHDRSHRCRHAEPLQLDQRQLLVSAGQRSPLSGQEGHPEQILQLWYPRRYFDSEYCVHHLCDG